MAMWNGLLVTIIRFHPEDRLVAIRVARKKMLVSYHSVTVLC